MKATVSLG